MVALTRLACSVVPACSPRHGRFLCGEGTSRKTETVSRARCARPNLTPERADEVRMVIGHLTKDGHTLEMSREARSSGVDAEAPLVG